MVPFVLVCSIWERGHGVGQFMRYGWMDGYGEEWGIHWVW